MEDQFKTFAQDLDMMSAQIKVLSDHLQVLAERQRQLNTLRAEIQFLQTIIDEQRRHA